MERFFFLNKGEWWWSFRGTPPAFADAKPVLQWFAKFVFKFVFEFRQICVRPFWSLFVSGDFRILILI
jgi:hypothetical protein